MHSDDIDWEKGILSFSRMKPAGRGKTPPRLTIGPELEKLLRRLVSGEYFFPYLRTVRSCDRATEFKQRCKGLGIAEVSLHLYRYAWAERALQCGSPERFAHAYLVRRKAFPSLKHQSRMSIFGH